ncbi:MAG: hypothetical protein RIQ33_1842 [Bacteroidota bacterium]
MMSSENEIQKFLSSYSDEVKINVAILRKKIKALLPNIIEQLDLPAKMIGYCYGQKYTDLICVIIPSKKGLKLGFNRGSSLPDPEKLLQGNGKISRYVEIHFEQQIESPATKILIESALNHYLILK